MRIHAAIVVLLLGAPACGSDGTTNPGSGGGGGGSANSSSSSGPATGEICTEYCGTVTQAACVSEPQTVDECDASCKSTFKALPFCASPVTTALECVAGTDPATFTCDGDGKLEGTTTCGPKQLDYVMCACFAAGGDASKVPAPESYCDAFCDKQKDLPCADDAKCRASCKSPTPNEAAREIAAVAAACIAKSSVNPFSCDEGDDEPSLDFNAVPAECQQEIGFLFFCSLLGPSSCDTCAAECATTLCAEPSTTPDAACLACVRNDLATDDEPGTGGGSP